MKKIIAVGCEVEISADMTKVVMKNHYDTKTTATLVIKGMRALALAEKLMEKFFFDNDENGYTFASYNLIWKD